MLNDDAIVHHDAVVWAHLEHLAGTTVRILPDTTVQAIVRGDDGVEAVDTDRRSDRDARRPQRRRRLVEPS